jgi:hypothetical protein
MATHACVGRTGGGDSRVRYFGIVYHALGCVKNTIKKPLQQKIALTLQYIFALSHNASTLWRKIIAFHRYRSRLSETVIAFYSYCARLMGNVIPFHIYGSYKMTKAITCNAIKF